MEENASQNKREESDRVSDEAALQQAGPLAGMIEQEEMGGDPVCWLHLLDDEGKMPDR